MTDQNISIESLVMDLKRVALGLHRGSFKMAERFKEEALNRGKEIEASGIEDLYLNKLIAGSRDTLMSTNERAAEDALMYSVLFQNYAQRSKL